jgi:hypothetical protein
VHATFSLHIVHVVVVGFAAPVVDVQGQTYGQGVVFQGEILEVRL